MHYEFELPSGMRVICLPRQSQVVYCGIAVDAGTRDETDDESGMAHFTEHMSFKGTEHRSARQIINRMETVGGELNAYTGKEETVYYCTLPRPYLARAIELLTDIVLHSTYPQHEMDREVEVVADEIESYNDSPSELIYDEFESLMFPGHPLGRNILGQAERLRQYCSADMTAFVRRQYRPCRMVLFVCGDVTPQQIERLVSKNPLIPRTSFQEESLVRRPLPIKSERGDGLFLRQRNTHQSHVMMGFPTFSSQDPRRIALFLLNNILGGPGMSSRLNMTLRERYGLVYTVESSLTSYTDAGLWSVYLGCDRRDVERCCRLVQRDLERLTAAPLSQRTFQTALRQLKGQVRVSYDNAENVAISTAKHYLHYSEVQTLETVCDRLDSLTPHILWETACQIFQPEHLLTLIYE